MKKRFTDTHLHRKPWFRSLPWMMRESWRILCADCDEIGVWEIDLDALNFSLNIPGGHPDRVTLPQLLEAFDLQVIEDDKLFIPGFIPFQYGDEAGLLSPKNKLLQKLVRKLKARNLPLPELKNEDDDESPIDPPSIQDASPPDGVKEEEEEVVEEEMKKGGVGENKSDAAKFENRLKFDFPKLFDLYPRCQKRGISLNLMAERIHTQEVYDEFEIAVTRYRKHCEREGTEQRHILTFPNFFDEWRDWLDEKTGTPKFEPKPAHKSATGPPPIRYPDFKPDPETPRSPPTPEQLRQIEEIKRKAQTKTPGDQNGNF